MQVKIVQKQRFACKLSPIVIVNNLQSGNPVVIGLRPALVVCFGIFDCRLFGVIMPFPFSDPVLISYLSFENAIKLRLVYSLCLCSTCNERLKSKVKNKTNLDRVL